MAQWDLPTNIGCIISPAGFGHGATNGVMKRIGKEYWVHGLPL
jgi:hypothetical protein